MTCRTTPARLHARSFLLVALLTVSAVVGLAQSAPSPAGSGDPAQDSTAASPVEGTANTPSENLDTAWSNLTNAVSDSKRPDLRTQALAALGLLGANPRAIKLIVATLVDHDVDVRTSAVLAAGLTKSPTVATQLRGLLDDKEPQVAFAAATTLWKMGDQSGEDILVAVVDGERSANATVMNGTMHSVSRDLHHPGSLAKFGAMQGAYMLLGPFGWGITAYDYMHKNGGDSARVTAVEQIADNHTAVIREKLLEALADKDIAVRVAAMKALSAYHDKDVAAAVASQLADKNAPVRLTAAASYILITGQPAAVKLAPRRSRR